MNSTELGDDIINSSSFRKKGYFQKKGYQLMADFLGYWS